MSNPQESHTVWTTNDVRAAFAALRGLLGPQAMGTPIATLIADVEIGEVGALELCADVAKRLNANTAPGGGAATDAEAAAGLELAWKTIDRVRPRTRGLAVVLNHGDGSVVLLAGALDAEATINGFSGMIEQITQAVGPRRGDDGRN